MLTCYNTSQVISKPITLLLPIKQHWFYNINTKGNKIKCIKWLYYYKLR